MFRPAPSPVGSPRSNRPGRCPNPAALAKYQVDAARLAELENALQAFEALASAPRASNVRSAAVTKELARLFRETEQLLQTQLDKLMAGFKATQRAFHHEYHAARVIVDAGGGAEAAEDQPAPGAAQPVAG